MDHSINVAIRKVRVALRDNPDKPRFVETVVGKGYRFGVPVSNGSAPNSQTQVQPLPSVAQALSATNLPSTTAAVPMWKVFRPLLWRSLAIPHRLPG